MNIAVIGSRSFNDYDLLCSTLKEYKITKIISGGARGADSLAEDYAKEYNIPIIVFYADWKDMSEPCIKKYGYYGEYNALAGIKRNTTIIENSDIIIAFWDGKSTGTKDSITKAEKLNKKVIIIKI